MEIDEYKQQNQFVHKKYLSKLQLFNIFLFLMNFVITMLLLNESFILSTLQYEMFLSMI